MEYDPGTGPPPSCIGQWARPWARPKEGAKARARARDRARARAIGLVMA